jgi:hypothetical protein
MEADQMRVASMTARRNLRWSYECVEAYHEEIKTSNYRSYQAFTDVHEGTYMLLRYAEDM